jgi:hypothetical protein
MTFSVKVGGLSAAGLGLALACLSEERQRYDEGEMGVRIRRLY